MFGNLLCFFNIHKWLPVKGAKIRLDWRSKWDAYEVTDGKCARCGFEAEIRRDYYW